MLGWPFPSRSWLSWAAPGFFPAGPGLPLTGPGFVLAAPVFLGRSCAPLAAPEQALASSWAIPLSLLDSSWLSCSLWPPLRFSWPLSGCSSPLFSFPLAAPGLLGRPLVTSSRSWALRHRSWIPCGCSWALHDHSWALPCWLLSSLARHANPRRANPLANSISKSC